MDFVISKLEEADKFTSELFEELDDMFSFGVSAKTKKGDKIIYQSSKQQFIQVNIITTKRFTKENKKAIRYEIEKVDSNLKVKPLRHLTCVIWDEENAICYYEDKGAEIILNRDEMDGNKYFFEKMQTGTATIQEQYKTKIKCLKQIQKMFNLDADKYDVRSTGWLCRNIAYDQTFQYLKGTSPVSDDEYKYVDGSCRGQLIIAEKDKVVENAFGYDINLFYTHMFTCDDFYFPMAEGELIDVNANVCVNTSDALYIYKLRILGKSKYFAETEDGYYNSYHIKLLRLLKIKFKRIGDFKMQYRNPMKSKDMFGYMLKTAEIRKTNPFAKDINNTTWGMLGRKAEFEIPTDDYDAVKHHHRLLRLDIGRKLIILSSEGQSKYKFETARLKPFITAFARLYVVENILLPLEEAGYNIYQTNTDGFVTDCKPENMSKIYKMGSEKGELKHDKTFEGKHIIKHVNRIEKC